MSSLRALEYTTVRVPYETLNKHFRVAQKTIEREVSHVQQALNAVDMALKPSLVTVESLRGRSAALKQRLHVLAEKCLPSVAEESRDGRAVDARVAYLAENTSDHRRIDRLIMEYLLRTAYYQTAAILADGMSNLPVFEQARQVVLSLELKSTTNTLLWCHENKSKLRRVHSSLEMLVRQQDVIELIKEDKSLEAVQYIRKHLSAPEMWESKQLPHVLGLLAVHDLSTCPPQYKHLLCNSRWEVLLTVFWEDFFRIYQLPAQSNFSACLQSGLCALKTPHCQPHSQGPKGDACPVCNVDMFTLAKDLPYAHASHSKLVDAYSGAVLDEHNAPMALPNGMVYGTATILQLANENDGKITCPRTGQTYNGDQALRLYVM